MAKQALQFWQGPLPPNLYSMLLRQEAPLIDRDERKEIFSYLPPVQGKVILDLPSGIGRYTKEFLKRGAKEVVAADVSLPFIKECQKRLKNFSNVSYFSCEANALHFDKKFDLIFINWLFLYLLDEEVKQLIEKIQTWLKPGGLLFFRESLAATYRKVEGDYFAIYRRYSDYPQFFTMNWEKVKEGNLQTYEKFFADPFQGFWIYKNLRNL